MTTANNCEPARFYRGFDLGWFPFVNNLDVPRRITKDIIDERIVPHTREVFGTSVKEAEDVLREGLKRFANDDRLLSEEATLGEILQNANRSLKALKQAAKSNPRSELIARRLARIRRSKEANEEAIEVLRSTLELNPGSQTLHYDLARTLMESGFAADIQNGDTILYHLKRSFTAGDRNHEVRFWYARQLCLMGKGIESYKIFDNLKAERIPYKQRRKVCAGSLKRHMEMMQFIMVNFIQKKCYIVLFDHIKMDLSYLFPAISLMVGTRFSPDREFLIAWVSICRDPLQSMQLLCDCRSIGRYSYPARQRKVVVCRSFATVLAQQGWPIASEPDTKYH